MATNTTVGRTVFVLGREVDGNRGSYIVEATTEYSVEIAAMVTYTDTTASFPYTIS